MRPIPRTRYCRGRAQTALCVLVLCWTVAYGVPGEASGHGEDLFKANCAKCHVLPDPHNLTAEEWAAQIELMAPLAGLNAADKAAVLEYLVAHAAKPGAPVLAEEQSVFAAKCMGCHATAQEIPPDPAQADQFMRRMASHEKDEDFIRYLIDHMEDDVGKALSEAEAHEIAEYLLLTKSKQTP